jgi:hypothetical protein
LSKPEEEKDKESRGYALRLPVELYELIRWIAEKEGRSVNKQMINMLQESADSWLESNPKRDRQPTELALAV